MLILNSTFLSYSRFPRYCTRALLTIFGLGHNHKAPVLRSFVAQFHLVSKRPSVAAMGNSASSGRGHHDETVDFGSLYPQGVYTGPQDWNQAVVAQLIVQRRLAPFYRPLEDYEESWDDEQILAALRELPDPESGHSDSASTKTEGSTSKSHHHKRSNTQKEINRGPEAAIYRGAIECPICFLVRTLPDSMVSLPSRFHFFLC